ncbi:SWIM zinc finger protein [Rubellimicrobium thermophilum DSM 16684]|uniref:SWIM zinc finger protein n=1 Tax=Rubellimicrobium thermophilum DSM 16684 TaxID=1123069 RepID=S9R246_9RHOB|nr:SWIM zinc finger family protein [Rubellimicrobium thermophilum]EPX85967.1 SWIM zinc finger protein [Rubellimicrobium thermophilum DSM 16684]
MDGQGFQCQVVSRTTGELYEIHLSRKDGRLTCRCTCPAARNGRLCKHRLSLLDGDLSDVRSPGSPDRETILDLLRGTEVEALIGELREMESRKAAIEAAIRGLKDRLGRQLDG